jgi:hypothetical protein
MISQWTLSTSPKPRLLYGLCHAHTLRFIGGVKWAFTHYLRRDELKLPASQRVKLATEDARCNFRKSMKVGFKPWVSLDSKS